MADDDSEPSEQQQNLSSNTLATSPVDPFKVRGLNESDASGGDNPTGVLGRATGAGEVYGVQGRVDTVDPDGGAGVLGWTDSGLNTGVKAVNTGTSEPVALLAELTSDPTGGTAIRAKAPEGNTQTTAIDAVSDDQVTTIKASQSGSSGAIVAEANGGRGLFANSQTSQGVWGSHRATNGTEAGVKGTTVSEDDDAAGVFGFAVGSTGKTAGVEGVTNSKQTGAAGVKGTSKTGATHGVKGITKSTDGSASGVKGTSTTGATAGVRGVTTSTDGSASGVKGTSTTGSTAGVRGVTESDTDDAAGVWGKATSADGKTFGVRGVTDSFSTDSAGVKGTSKTGTTYGVLGVTTSDDSNAAGIKGKNTTGIGVACVGDLDVTGDLDMTGAQNIDNLGASVYLAFNQSITADGTPQLVKLDAEHADDFDTYDQTNYVFSCPTAGNYHVSTSVEADDSTFEFTLSIRVNGTAVASRRRTGSNHVCKTLYDLNNGDDITITVSGSSADDFKGLRDDSEGKYTYATFDKVG